MTIYKKIRDDFTVSRKNKDGMAAFYSTLIGEMDNEASRAKDGSKEVTDEIAIKVLKSFKKNLVETFNAENGDNYTTTLEINVVDGYLPQQMTRDDLVTSITLSGAKTMKDIMAHLKQYHAGLYDGKLASEVAKEFI